MMKLPVKIQCNRCDYISKDSMYSQASLSAFWNQYKNSTNGIPHGIGFCPKCLTGILVPIIAIEQAQQNLENISEQLFDPAIFRAMNGEIREIHEPMRGRIIKYLEQILINIDKITLTYFFLNHK